VIGKHMLVVAKPVLQKVEQFAGFMDKIVLTDQLNCTLVN